MSKTDEAVTSLEALGLTEYEARCFVALTRLSKGTAREIGQVADVPRSRVYDTVDRLDRRGLVSVQQSDPREYKAVPVETACSRIREGYDSRLNAAESALQQVEAPEATDDEGMWAITEADHVADRIVAFLDGADESIHLVVADEEAIDERILEGLRTAAERGVDVLVEVPSTIARDRVEDAVSDATIVVATTLQSTDVVYAERPAQLLLVDGRAVVAAGIEESGLPDVTRETAVWTYGRDHGFAVWIRHLLDQRLAERGEGRE